MLAHPPLSNYHQYCTGYQNPDNSGTGYILSASLNTGQAPILFQHPGSEILDQINAFDQAEATGTYLGEINMITVSSFCGPQGLIWGYDIVPHDSLVNKRELLITKLQDSQHRSVPVYSGEPLFKATQKLLGTRDRKRFPILPGSHLLCATKNIIKPGPCYLYCSLAIGIPRDRAKHACLLMENIGEYASTNLTKKDLADQRDIIKLDTAKSILQIGLNQKIEYQEIFVQVKDIAVKNNHVGCALVTAPYLCLAQKAVPENFSTVKELRQLPLSKWEQMVKSSYLSASKKNDNM